MIAEELRKLWMQARPLIEEQMAIAEKLAGLRDAATAKGIDWSQLKALCKAQIADETDEKGTSDKLGRLLDKASTATAYADLLGLSTIVNENKKTRLRIAAGGEVIEPPPTESAPATSNTDDRDRLLEDSLAGMQALRGAA